MRLCCVNILKFVFFFLKLFKNRGILINQCEVENNLYVENKLYVYKDFYFVFKGNLSFGIEFGFYIVCLVR